MIYVQAVPQFAIHALMFADQGSGGEFEGLTPAPRSDAVAQAVVIPKTNASKPGLGQNPVAGARVMDHDRPLGRSA